MTTLYHETMKRLNESLNCTLIASDLDLDHGVKHRRADDSHILEYALLNRFSRIPLFSKEEGLEKVITHVAIVDLEEERVKKRPRLTTEDLIAGSTPIHKAIVLLSRRPFYFVLDWDRIHKILTRSDLNRLPVRTYLHTLLDHLEWLLAESIERVSPDNSWTAALSEAKQQSICDRHKEKQLQDFDTRLIDCTTLSDKATLTGKSPSLLTVLAQEDSETFREQFWQSINLLRNQVDHVGQLTKSTDLEWLARGVSVLQAWTEALSGVIED